ncbi:MAG: DUF1614 domain-containing protein [Candidatus Thorarchaeota archaeon]
MSDSRLRYSKRSFSVFAILAMLMMGILFFQFAGIVFVQLGIPPWLVVVIVIGSLVGSAVNIPVTTIQSQSSKCPEQQYMKLWGLTYRIVSPDCPGETLISVNLGGAVIPVVVSAYLLIIHPQTIPVALLGILIVSLFVKAIARVEPNVGIVTPGLLPPLIAGIASTALMLLIPGMFSPHVLAYVSGTLGTLIGADLLNLNKISELQTGSASIGGAGTWDGVFLAGLLAVFFV